VNIVLIDLENVTTITSQGLMALIEAFRAVNNAGGKLFICSINEQVRILFELTGLDEIFETFANLDEFKNTMLIKQ
jgi:anti-sigma B factor antagonist